VTSLDSARGAITVLLVFPCKKPEILSELDLNMHKISVPSLFAILLGKALKSVVYFANNIWTMPAGGGILQQIGAVVEISALWLDVVTTLLWPC
jgi:hypothetical protein